ncbi:MAG: hypothetical protein AB9858_11255 [Acidaminococcaceae bacterium]
MAQTMPMSVFALISNVELETIVILNDNGARDKEVTGLLHISDRLLADE